MTPDPEVFTLGDVVTIAATEPVTPAGWPIDIKVGVDHSTLASSTSLPFTSQYVIPSTGDHTFFWENDNAYASVNWQISCVHPDPVTSTTALNASPSTQVLGQPVTLSGTVSAPHPPPVPPTGTITLFDGNTPLQSAAVASDGSYQLTTTDLGVGTHTLYAAFGNDPNYQPSTSVPIQVVITRIPTSLTAQPAVRTLSGGPRHQPGAILRARLLTTTPIAAAAGQPLVFRAGTAVLCTTLTDTTGSASCTTTATGELRISLQRGYTVSFAGSASLQPATTQAGIARSG